jgi:phosphoesterase RecJ-like protein
LKSDRGKTEIRKEKAERRAIPAMIEQVLESIDNHQRFLVTSHARPDGDAIGSVLGTRELLRALGKQADAVMSDPVPVIYRPLPFAEEIQHLRSVNGKYEAAIILECDSVQRTGLTGVDAPGRVLINIDHHNSARPFAQVNWIKKDACATAEMIFDLVRAAKVKLTPEMATCLYTAVLTDTGSFCFFGTNERTFALAEELVRGGADPARIAHNVYFANPEGKMRLLGCALGTMQRCGTTIVMHVTQEHMHKSGAREEDCEGLVNYALSIEGVETALFFRELPDGRFRVSLRSKGDVDVASIAEKFGGGGHRCASGCSLQGPLERATEYVLQFVQGGR